MSEHQRPNGNETFEQTLQRLRLKIDLLPVEQRPHLFELADVVEWQHRRTHQRGGQQGNASD